MGNDTDIQFFRELAEMDPADICKRALCIFDAAEKTYSIPAWGSTLDISLEKREIFDSSGKRVNRNTGLPVLFYLLRSSNVLVRGEWITEKDIPGGVSFFTGPHAIPSEIVTEKVNNNLETFRRACSALGGEERDMGDSSFEFRILPRIPVIVLYWLGDDEFEAEVKLLFDRTIGDHLPLDVIFVLICELLSRISGKCSCGA